VASGLSAEIVGRLVASPRIRPRVARLLSASLGMGGEAFCHPIDAKLVLVPPAALTGLAYACGAVCHSRRVRALVRGPDISAFVARFGHSARDLALLHESPFPTSVTADLLDDVARDSGFCLGAYLLSLPDWAAKRLRLMHPCTVSGPEFVQERASLLRALALATLP
jgi:hypothetical protein